MLTELIKEAVREKQGNKEFALFSLLNGQWRAEIGNTGAPHVMLGESWGEFRGEGSTPGDAVLQLLDNMRNGKRH